MILKPDKDGAFTISFLLLPEYAMVALLSAIEPLRVANRFAGRKIFRWQLLSEDGPPVAASNLLALQQTVAICDAAAPLIFLSAPALIRKTIFGMTPLLGLKNSTGEAL